MKQLKRNVDKEGRPLLPSETRLLEFEGDELARVSTRRGNAPRWTEVHVYRTSDGSYVLNTIGQSVISGEIPLTWWGVVSTPAELVAEMFRWSREDEHYFLPTISMEALEEAAYEDNELDAYLEEHPEYLPRNVR